MYNNITSNLEDLFSLSPFGIELHYCFNSLSTPRRSAIFLFFLFRFFLQSFFFIILMRMNLTWLTRSTFCFVLDGIGTVAVGFQHFNIGFHLCDARSEQIPLGERTPWDCAARKWCAEGRSIWPNKLYFLAQ